ncbi:hypothetical protein [Streptomyces sp. DSM 15324]|uniref:hypothetical protein n=1 Tax=Streptomyces sp. DSM 15324 TaxID=1739111 RepID=UPI0007472F14|nr:hypothetical protein [Streptomyces sp. DSM 15324]KUO07278.1 hypothetical protein AQJ58_36715 [Streptomyces sp. DSM 15324]
MCDHTSLASAEAQINRAFLPLGADLVAAALLIGLLPGRAADDIVGGSTDGAVHASSTPVICWNAMDRGVPT